MIKRITHRLKCLMAGLLFFSALSNSFAFNPTFPGKQDHAKSILMDTCKLVCPGDLTFTLSAGECTMIVTYDVHTTGDCLPSVPVQTSGLASGSAFPIGITQNCFMVDLPPLGLPDGDTMCCFNVTVNAFPNPTSAITCTDLAFISLDGDCGYCINAADVLEGGPYGCFDNYLVELDKTVPYGNGPWVSGCVGPTDINKTYQVRITEPVFGNKCWGNVKIEDKLAPVLDCPSAQLPCNLPNVTPEYVKTVTSTLKFAADNLPTSIDTGQYFIFNIPVGVNAVVNDVDCRVNIANANAWNVQIEVISPAGTSALIWDALGGCNLGSVFARFDDEGLASNQCADLIADLNLDIMSVLGFDSLGVFDGENAEGTWQVKISNPDLQGFGQVAVVEIVELYINQTGQFSAGFPNGLSGNCVQAMGNNQYLVPAGCGDPQLDNCSAVTLRYVDTTIPDDCSSGLAAHINRTWTAEDASGNITTCIQRIDQFRPSLTDVSIPPNYDDIEADAFTCINGVYPSPEWLENQGLEAWPLAFGLPIGCNLASAYVDTKLNICDGTYKILRNWTIIDWCSGEVVEHSQVIKVTDAQSPVFDCPTSQSVTTDAFNCCATINLPDVIIADDCSSINSLNGIVTLFDPATGQQIGIENVAGSLANFPGNDPANPDTLGVLGSTTCLPKGTHIVTYYAEDNCGNTTTCTFNLTINDYTPPVAVCDEKTVVAIGIDDPADCFGPEGPNGNPAALGACAFGGISWVKAATFDNGSYDQCDHVKFTIRRTAPYSDCILGLNATNGNMPCNDVSPDFPSEFERAISEQDSIKFYSCEVGTMQPVILRVYQVDSNGIIANSPNGVPLFNECIIQVEVTDKIKPVCTPPSNTVVSCEQFNPDLSQYGNALLVDNCCLDTTKIYGGQCGLTHTANYSNFDTLCNKGTILRTFHAFDCQGNSSQCTQQVVVNYNQDYFIQFPDDVLVTNCNGTGVYGEPTFFGEDCELLAVSYEDEVFTVVPDACYKIERTWTVINWCTFNPLLQPTTVPNPNPNAVANHPSNLPGPIVSACGTLPPWSATIVKINPTDPDATDYCSFWSADANGYRYKQIIKIVDTQDPEIANCPTSSVTFTDSTLNDPELWHNVFNPSLPSQDLKERATNLSISSSDACDGGNLYNTKFLLFLDLDNDGNFESVINSENLPGADTILYDNINTPGYLGGTPVTFDSRPVPTNQKWHFTFQGSTSPNSAFASVRWNTALDPNIFVAPQLPHGTHKIRWTVTDQCGNLRNCEHVFTIEQGPTSGIETLESDGFALFQNEPNPFSQTTSIGFRLPTAAEAKLSVFDAEGRLIFERTDAFKEGYNAVQLEASQLRVPSLLYYKLESGSHVAWRKMVVVR